MNENQKRGQKLLLFIIAMALLAAILIATDSRAQTYALDSNGNVIKTTSITKQPDKIYQIVDNTTFYISQRGAVYYWKTSKSGKLYKVYLEKTEPSPYQRMKAISESSEHKPKGKFVTYDELNKKEKDE